MTGLVVKFNAKDAHLVRIAAQRAHMTPEALVCHVMHYCALIDRRELQAIIADDLPTHSDHTFGGRESMQLTAVHEVVYTSD